MEEALDQGVPSGELDILLDVMNNRILGSVENPFQFKWRERAEGILKEKTLESSRGKLVKQHTQSLLETDAGIANTGGGSLEKIEEDGEEVFIKLFLEGS